MAAQATDERLKFTDFDDMVRTMFATRDPLALVVDSLCRWVPRASTETPVASSFHAVFRTYLGLIKLLTQYKKAVLCAPESAEPPLSAELVAVCCSPASPACRLAQQAACMFGRNLALPVPHGKPVMYAMIRMMRTPHGCACAPPTPQSSPAPDGRLCIGRL